MLLLTLSCSNSTNKGYTIEEEEGKEAFVVEYNQAFESPVANKLNSSALDDLKSGNLLKAKKLFLKALKIEPNNPVLLNNIGLVERDLGNINASIEYFKKSFSASEYSYIQAVANLAMTFYQIENYKEAIATAQFVLDRNPNKITYMSTLLTLSLSYAESGECSLAEAALQELKQKIEHDEFKLQIEQLEVKIFDCYK